GYALLAQRWEMPGALSSHGHNTEHLLLIQGLQGTSGELVSGVERLGVRTLTAVQVVDSGAVSLAPSHLAQVAFPADIFTQLATFLLPASLDEQLEPFRDNFFLGLAAGRVQGAIRLTPRLGCGIIPP